MSFEILDYNIHKCSSYSPAHLPINIKRNIPSDQSSRWSSESNNPPQYLLLKLTKYAIVRTITFGKYEKTHVCNLKKFKIFGGTNEENMVELLEGGLKNDSQAETFELKYQLLFRQFACRYIKIVPLQSWGSSFNFTIWFIQLKGVTYWPAVECAIDWLTKYRQTEAVRVCLKYLREMGFRESYETLKRESYIELEDPFLTRLHTYAINGCHKTLEEVLERAVRDGHFRNYLYRQAYKPTWRSINAPKPRPGMRGGHQMCLDSYSQTLYLFGGWDGYRDLADLWAYHIPSNKWTLLSDNTKAQGGPSARSCHKMCLDPERRQIFVLGRYIDLQMRSQTNLKSDFYVYDIETAKWTLITDDTSAMGGPLLIFDHQMCMDVSKRTLYVFGGRILMSTSLNEFSEDENGANNGAVVEREPYYSGLYAYEVSTNTWNMIGSDISMCLGVHPLKSRVGHSMLFHPVSRKLYIFAGQRNRDYLNDFFTFNIDTGDVDYICGVGAAKERFLPAAGFTQRATIDPELDQIYVLSGLSKEKDKREENVQNAFWVYYIKDDKWSCVYKNENENTAAQCYVQNLEPCPRFAHQLIYDQVSKVHYLFGGNPGVSAVPKLRLDDFWKLHFNKRTNSQVQRGMKLIIRTHRFKELALTDSVEALRYLQEDVKEVVDLESPIESEEFLELPRIIFKGNLSNASREKRINQIRNHMFEKICDYFPDERAAPRASLEKLLPL